METPKEVEALTYEIFVLRRMLEQLPPPVGSIMLKQLDKVIHTIKDRDNALKTIVSSLVDDAILEIKMQEFDLEVTRKERDQFKDQLG